MGLYLSFRAVARFILMRFIEISIIVAAILLIPNLPPYCNFNESYRVTPPMPYEGPLALNTKLNGAEYWFKGLLKGPESFAMFEDELYVSVIGGEVVKLLGNSETVMVAEFGQDICEHEYDEKICGRPLGLVFNKKGDLYAADAYYGIYKVDTATRQARSLVSADSKIDGKTSKMFNSVQVSKAGEVYWSHSSTQFDLENGIFDLLADGTGRLVKYDPKTSKNTVLMDNLHFANGLYLAEDESFILVSETARSRILRYYLKGSKAGTHDIFLDGLPGSPDNLQRDGQGNIFVSLVQSRNTDFPNLFNVIQPFPLIRKFIARCLALVQLTFTAYNRILPSQFAKIGEHFIGHFSSVAPIINGTLVTILRVSESGKILDALHGTDGKIFFISETFIHGNYLLFGSPLNDYIARIPLKRLGWEHMAVKRTTLFDLTPEGDTGKGPYEDVDDEVVTEEPTVVKEAPKVVKEAPKLVKEAPKVVKEAPKIVKEAPKVVKEAAPVVKESPKVVKVEPKVVKQDEPTIVKREAPKVVPGTKTPSAAKEAPKQVVNEAPVVKEVPKQVVKEAAKPVVKEVPKKVVAEAPKTVVKEAPKPVAKDAPKPVLKEKPKAVEKEVPKPVVKEAPKPVVNAAPKPAVKETSKPVVKEAPKPVADQAPKQVVKEAPKQVVKEAPKPVVKEAPKQETKTVPVASQKTAQPTGSKDSVESKQTKNSKETAAPKEAAKATPKTNPPKQN